MESIKLFEQKKVRSQWDAEKEMWYFSITDVIAILTDSVDAVGYWRKLKERLKKEGNESVTNCHALKMLSPDNKMRLTDVANTEQLLRLIQSIPSPNAEPFKQWLAKVGYERMQEMTDPEQGLDRARENWQKLGRSEKWIQQRMTGQETRNKLTDYWKDNGVEKSEEFAFLTNIIHQEWTGLTVKNHKDLKDLKSQNLRDHMSEAELIFTALAELSTRQIAETDVAKGVPENARASRKGGAVAKNARLELEAQTGKSVVTGENFLPPAKVKAVVADEKPQKKNKPKPKKKPKKWTDNQEIELENCYLTLDMDMKALKERFNCSAAEIRQKLKELGAWQGY